MPETVLIVDDDPSQLRMAEYAVGQKLKYRAVTAAGGEEAVRWLVAGRQPQPDLVLLDLAMPERGGLQVIRAIRAHKPQLPIVLLAAYGDDEHIAQAIDAGACDFLTKPAALGRLKLTLQNTLKAQRMSDAIACLERKTSGHVGFADVIGQSPRMKEARTIAEAAASSRLPIWIEGEPGCGKEWLARAIHGSGDRAGKPFVAVDCRALPEVAAESILFGQDTLPGKLHYALGRLREADQGTLLLKGVGVLPPPVQHRLLEALESGKVKPLGAAAPVPVNLRVLCTSSEKAESLIAQGRFSHLLYRQLKGMSLAVPPLRDRRPDIPLLAQHFISFYAASENKHIRGLTEQALQQLTAAPWPGNVRQLSHLLWRAVILCNQDIVDTGDLQMVRQWHPVSHEGMQDYLIGPLLLDMQGRMKKLKSIEEEVIRFALHHSGGCMTRAARSLGIGRSTLYRRVSELETGGKLSDAYMTRANQTTRPIMKVSSAERS